MILVGPGGLPETGFSLFRPCGLRAAGARWQMLLGSHLVEPPTSTMSRPIGRTKTRVDALKVAGSIGLIKARLTITGGNFLVVPLPAAHAGLITLAVNDSQ